jgi:DNA-binding transcriptional LysR family regulator
VSLTPTGRALLPQARTAVAAVQQMRDAGALSRGRVRGTLRLGMITNLESLGLPAVVGEFHRTHPDVELSLRTSPRGSTGLLDDVRRGRTDVAFCGLPVSELGGVLVRVLRRQPFVALLPPGHRFEGSDRVSVGDLVDDDFVEMPKGFGNRRIVDDWLADHALTRRVTMEVPDLTTVPDYVAAGLGVAVVPAQAAPAGRGAVAGQEVVGPIAVPLVEPLVWELSVIARKDGRSPAVDALLAHLARRLPVHGNA